MLSFAQVLYLVDKGPLLVPLYTDVIPPPLAQGRVPLGGRGREGEGGTEGTYLCTHAFSTLWCLHII